MKIKLLIAIVGMQISGLIQAQNNELLLPEVSVFMLPRMVNINMDLSNEIRLATHFKIPDNQRLNRNYFIESAFAKHTTFTHFINNKEVLFSGVKLHQYPNGSIAIQSYLTELPIYQFNNHLPYLLPTQFGLVSVKKQIVDDVAYPKTQYVDENEQIWYQDNVYKYTRRDTTANAKVFYVNPINSANTKYGGDFVDNFDATNESLNNEQKWVQMQVQYENGIYYLESENMYFDELSAPNDNNTYEHPIRTYDYTRDNNFFEAINAYYHINNIANYSKTIGYQNLVKKIAVDVHALGGADNSGYDPNNHTLLFGEGGVDDAEDGEVIVHEYTHSLSEMASPNTTEGTQRKAMEEGICDYYAKAYSRTYNDNTPNQIFSWDGHNEFWDGFPINSSKKYPFDLTNSKDGDRDIWSSALMCIHDFIGRETTDSLVLEHLYYQAPNTTMPAMAQAILSIDSANFNGRNYAALKTCFVAAGFMQHGARSQFLKFPTGFKVLNSEGFAMGLAPLAIEFGEETEWMIYDGLGREVKSGNANTLILNPLDYCKGLYVLTFTQENRIHTLKIIR